jgi:protein CpxP
MNRESDQHEEATMKLLMVATAAAGLLVGGADLAQAQQGSNAAPTANTTTSKDSNQAVATTRGNQATPAKGANSFTMAEAKSRLERDGFSNVGELKKDADGVWHGQAQKGGNTTTVWLDYKGNVGESK